MDPAENTLTGDLLRPWLLDSLAGEGDLEPLARIGFAHPDEAARNLVRLGSGGRTAFWIDRADTLGQGIAAAPDPDLALTSLQRLDEITDLSTTFAEADHLVSLLRILGAGSFFGETMIRAPEIPRWLFDREEVGRNAVEAIADLTYRDLDDTSPEQYPADLNRLKRRELLRIGARAALGSSSVEEEWLALADLADHLLQAVLHQSWPTELARPAIIGVGKLGGRELNFSSDIDLIFTLQPERGSDLTAAMHQTTLAVERFVEILTRYTSEGSLYRVDLRLRPGGDRAPLVRSRQWMVSYYAAQGAAWERQMLVKARSCAGDIESGDRFLELLTPFIYPTHAVRNPGEEAHRLRRERRAREGGSLSEEHVKLAPGAIRDIEFIVQVFQLLYGGRHPGVRHPSTSESIARLTEAGLLPAEDAGDLAGAYSFFRRLETVLQMQEDRQVFTLPVDSHRRLAIARLMDFSDSRSFLDSYHRRRAEVTAVLNGLLPGAGEEQNGEPVEGLLNLPVGGEEASFRLEGRGFREPEQSHRVLVATGSLVRTGGTNAWAAFVGVLPPLLNDAVATGAPDRALNNLERILRRLGSPGAYMRLLAREDSIRRAILLLCASGDLLTDLLVRHPEHFERLFSRGAAGVAAERIDRIGKLRHLRSRSGSSRDLVHDLEAVRTREFLAAGLSWIIGERNLGETMSDLGLLADDLLHCFLGVHFREFLVPPQVAVLSLGTLSARSMTFASDADLLFIHREGAGTEIQELAARVGGLLSPPGGPYQVDLRLRPEGRSAPTSVDPAYLASYLPERASLWEYLALRRARPLYGRRALLGEALDVIDEWLEGFRLDDEVRQELRKVRTLQEEEVRKESQAISREILFDVKRSPGGMADIEYLVLGLTTGRRAGRGAASAHIPDLIPPLVAAGTFTVTEGGMLGDAYRQLRTIQVALQLHFGRDITRIPQAWFDEPPPIVLPEGTMERLTATIKQVRALFDREYPRVE